jgi:hypothetical protein
LNVDDPALSYPAVYLLNQQNSDNKTKSKRCCSVPSNQFICELLLFALFIKKTPNLQSKSEEGYFCL